jgi:hypothetical protein
MKYIIFEVLIGSMRMKMPFIFPDIFVHSEMALILIKQIQEQFGTNAVSTFSAGEINLIDVECVGQSSTLEVKSHKGDSETITMFKYLRGM